MSCGLLRRVPGFGVDASSTYHPDFKLRYAYHYIAVYTTVVQADTLHPPDIRKNGSVHKISRSIKRWTPEQLKMELTYIIIYKKNKNAGIQQSPLDVIVRKRGSLLRPADSSSTAGSHSLSACRWTGRWPRAAQVTLQLGCS